MTISMLSMMIEFGHLAGKGPHKEPKQKVTSITDIFDMGEETVHKGKPERER